MSAPTRSRSEDLLIKSQLLCQLSYRGADSLTNTVQVAPRDAARFWVAVLTPAGTDGCWLWPGAAQSSGYGSVGFAGRTFLAHRVAYELTHGRIPDGLTVDHLCREKLCVNPDHLEAVSLSENVRRASRVLTVGGLCLRGHLITAESDIYLRPNGGRECRQCRRANSAKRRVNSGRTSSNYFAKRRLAVGGECREDVDALVRDQRKASS